MLALVAAPVSYAPMVAPVASPSRAAAPVMETVQDLEVLAKKCAAAATPRLAGKKLAFLQC